VGKTRASGQKFDQNCLSKIFGQKRKWAKPIYFRISGQEKWTWNYQKEERQQR
jgi:hypothetical protein